MKRLGIFLLIFALASCSRIIGERGLFRDRSDAYLDSGNGPQLVVPKPMSDSKLSRYYIIPASNAQPGATPLPPGSFVAKQARAMHRDMAPLSSHDFQLDKQGHEPQLVINQKLSSARESVFKAIARRHIKMVPNSMRERSVAIYDMYTTYDKLTDVTPIYQVVLHPMALKTRVRIINTKGKAINPKTAERILKTIARGLRGHQKQNSLVRWLGERL